MEQLKNAMAELKYSNKMSAFNIFGYSFLFLIEDFVISIRNYSLLDKRISKEYAKMLFE
jgi:hypothetical protein